MNVPPISPMINAAFNVARAKYRAEHIAWTNLSGVLSGRFNLPIAMMNIQRQGDLDLLLRCMEDEFEANMAADAADTSGSNMTFHYQLSLSETWVVGCYEIMRALRQRDRDAMQVSTRPSGVSGMQAFKSIFADLELLRMPMVKFEIAKDFKLKEPLQLQRGPANNDASDHTTYDSNDPTRSHLMPSSISPRGSVRWAALDHLANRQHWIERRDLAERFLAMGNEIIPAGILEAQERAAKE
ncbi:MAG: hypothetical protein Q8M18_00925 [Bradyrhizobium sp.]|nr:hypothetical protein [Bradyrhizobium sp.]